MLWRCGGHQLNDDLGVSSSSLPPPSATIFHWPQPNWRHSSMQQKTSQIARGIPVYNIDELRGRLNGRYVNYESSLGLGRRNNVSYAYH